MGRVTHFDITAENIEEIQKFYSDIFGWSFKKWDGPFDYWMITTGPEDSIGIDGGLSPKDPEGLQVTNTIEVESVDGTFEKVKAAGGSVVAEKMPIPGFGYFGIFKDPEGNLFGIMQEDSSAK